MLAVTDLLIMISFAAITREYLVWIALLLGMSS